MIGKLVSDDVDGTILLDVNGVGYEITVPLGAVGRSRSPSGDAELVLHIHTHVREDTFSLYGFSSPVEREVFRTLIALPGIGPKLALSILSALPPRELAAAVSGNDLKRLNSVHGVGKKTAERLVLELRERLPKLGIAESAAAPAQAVLSDDRTRLLGALVNMGYKPIEAEKAVEAVKESFGKEPISDLLRASLAHLAR
jgi:holliday junction DNA helicase RuvA